MKIYYWSSRRLRNQITFAFVLIFICLNISCQKTTKRTLSKGIYYWRTNLHISDYEHSVLDSLNTKYLYVRFFDVDITPGTNSIKPVAIVHFQKQFHTNRQIIPVVFVTPRALDAMSPSNVAQFAQKISQLLANKATQINLQPEEIQIDCDWNQRNKKRYFTLLKILKTQPFFQNKTVSATVRLHQIKYQKQNGIPPVDKGLLMVYNMDKLTDIHVHNSIISLQTAKQYLSSIDKYPILLDIALPIYSWTLLFNQKNGALRGILRNIRQTDLDNNAIFIPENRQHFRIATDTVYKGYALKKGDIIRHEQADFQTVNSVSQYLSSQIKVNDIRVSLYYCDSINFRNFPAYEMDKIFNNFN